MADDIGTCSDLEPRLAPYIDGEDTAPARRAVEDHLRTCPGCERLVRDEVAAREMLHRRREALSAHAPEGLRARCGGLSVSAPRPESADLRPASTIVRTSPSALRRWAPLSLAATLVLAVAGVIAFGLNDRVQALAASLAVDHVKCFKVNGTAGEADAQASERAWQQGEGWPIAVPQTAPSQALKLIGVRLCLSSDGRVAHLMYTWGGEPLSVYVLQADAGHDETAHRMGAQEIIWRANHRTYAVVSGDRARDLTPIVDYMKGRVR
ncbi:MAG TPA: zf-HC2 domain-containing protein [Vicinamibacterales bacterium]|jgi:anti-sigma factor RsiW